MSPWTILPAWALTVLDGSISGPGAVGVGRKGSVVGTTNFDDFSVQTPATDQSFDATPVGQLPDNWSSYKTNNNDVAAVATPPSPLAPISGANVFAITGAGSGDAVRAWLNTSLPSDLTASAYTYLNVATPAQVFARGSGLATSSPSYYAVEVSSSMNVKLVKVVGGTETDLASLSSVQYVQNIWVQETLALSGTTLQAQVYRPDTQQYLNSSGNWQSAQTWALTATDSSLTGGGQAGVGRPTKPEYAQTNYFDDFTTVTGTEAQTFDASTAMPSGLSQSNMNQFSVVSASSAGIPALSSPNVLQSTPGSAASQIWDNTQALTNAQVSAGMYLPSTGAQVIARGTGLGTSTPSYYGLSVSPTDTGLVVELVKVVNGGSPTVLATLAPLPYYPTNYFSGQWVQATLYVDGANVRAQVYRPDTGEYLDSQDQWQPDPTYALNYTDPTPLTAAGYGGLARNAGSGSNLYFDNLSVTPLSVASTPPTVTISAPSGTQTGTVTITATPTEPVPNYSIAKVEFYVDDNSNPILNAVATAAPYTWNFDTSTLKNGTHTLLVMAYDNQGNVGTATTTITTSNNTALSLPSSFPASPNPIGNTELAYAETAPDTTLLQDNDVQVVVDDAADLTTELSAIHADSSNAQQLIYANASNIYSDELTAWLSYARQNGINAEDAFYHVAIATPYTGGSPNSTDPVDYFWGVFDQNGKYYTEAAYYGGSTIPFGGSVNNSILMGYLEPYGEINFDLSSVASGGWSSVLEYPTAVDSQGNPTAWGTITPLTDTTNGFTHSGQGQITFAPPSDWVPASVTGSTELAPMYYVRIRTVAAGTAPIAVTIKGDNYTNSPDGSKSDSGVIPAYDWALDPQGGYLNPQQYAIASAAGYTAHFGYQSRLFYDGSMRFFTNPANSQFQAWAASYFPSLMTGTQYANGLFFDNPCLSPTPLPIRPMVARKGVRT